MQRAHRQQDATLRLEQGPTGAEAVADGADVVILVDVLSFTTAVSVALDRGTVVLPHRSDEASARQHADRHGAVLAVGRSAEGPGDVSLSPASLRRSAPPAPLVLPSPNGSAIAEALGARGAACVASCLRTTTAVADWLARTHGPSARVAVVAAGERWPGGGLRPAVEDLWGAGAVVAGLVERGWTAVSPEAAAARAAHAAVRGAEREALRACASGRELVEAGHGADVDIAAEVDASRSVALLVGGRFVGAP